MQFDQLRRRGLTILPGDAGGVPVYGALSLSRNSVQSVILDGILELCWVEGKNILVEWCFSYIT